MSKPHSRRLRFWILYFSFTCLVIALLLEAAVRLFHLAPPLPSSISFVSDPFLPFKPEPFSTTVSRTREFECEYRHNSMGLRDDEHPVEKPNGVFRILALGDSFTYGAGVSFNDSFLHRLEEMLNSRPGHMKVEIIKAGISRYYPEPERIFLEHYGLQYRPDLVLVGFLPNDIIDTHLGIDSIRVGPTGYLVTRQSQNRSKLVTLLYTYSHVFRILFNKYNAMRSPDTPIPWDEVYKENGVYESDWQKAESELKKIVDLANSIKARTVIMYIPQQGPWRDLHSYPASRLARLCSQQHALFVDTLPGLRASQASPDTRDLYYLDDGHCRPAGYKAIAETLYTKLTSEGVVP